MKKIIVFDVDWVITDSGAWKEAIIQRILEEHGLFDIPGVAEIFWIGLNRIILLDRIYDVKPFDKALVLAEINRDLFIQESQVSLNLDTFEFIKNNYKKYDFFTNTSLPKRSLQMIFADLDIGKYFMELLAYDDGSKKENIEYVIQVHWVKPENILFMDDKQSHIDAVKPTWVLTLLFEQDWVSLEQKVNNIFQ